MQRKATELLVESEAIVERPEDFDAIRDRWLASLKDFIDRILKPILPDAKERKKYITPEAMEVWERAFTHPSFDPRRDYNYDVLEFMGDRALKYAFNKYLIRRYPELDQAQLTVLDNRYMTKAEQPKYGKEMGLDKHVRIIGMQLATTRVLGDLFESFIGALDMVSDQVEDGLGIIHVYNFLVQFFKAFQFEIPQETGGHAKTDVQQIFSRFGVGIPEEIWTEEAGTFRLQIKATPEIIELLKAKGPGGFNIQLRSPILGEAKGSKEAAKNSAYENALETLRSYGVTTVSARLMKQLKDFAIPELLPLRAELEQKLREDGLHRPLFYKPSKLHTNEWMTIMLMGEDAFGVARELGHIRIPKGQDENLAKKQLVQNYIAEERKGKEGETLGLERKKVSPRRGRGRPRKVPSPRRARPKPRTVPSPRRARPKPRREKISPRRKRGEPPSPRRARPERVRPKKISPRKERAKPSPQKKVPPPKEKEKVLPPKEPEEQPPPVKARGARKKELTALRVVDLKEILREKELKVGGKKADLVERILDVEF